jgi:hypothetical protein
MMKSLRLVLAITVLCSTAANAQSPAVEPAGSSRPVERLIGELTAEVRALHAALERWHIENGQMLLAFERYRLQRQVAASASSRLEALRVELAGAQRDALHRQEETQNAEANLRGNADPQYAQALQDLAREAGMAFEQARTREARLSEQERRLSVEADNEQRNAQAFERWLESTAAPAAPRQ